MKIELRLRRKENLLNSFDELSLSPALKKALTDINWAAPTPVQAEAIPVALTGVDLIVSAQTGTGKTAAFVLPILERAIANPEKLALILTPTRELAAQIAEVIFQLTKYAKHIRAALIIGGDSYTRQIRALQRKPTILVATPGRLNDHLDEGRISLKNVSTLVLDEADRMLDMGFAPQIETIMKQLPAKRQSLLFSATLPKETLRLANTYLKDPAKVAIGEQGLAVDKIEQSQIELRHEDKNEQVLGLIDKSRRTLIFTRTKIRADRLSKYLIKMDVRCVAIHGGKTQSQRNKAISMFRADVCNVLVATDVASRGLDIPEIECVVNFDLPQSKEDYVHRIGRTARAGAAGRAISFVTPEERSMWRYISSESSSAPSKKAGGRGGRGGRIRGFFAKRPKFRKEQKRASYR
ncbi:MAG: ATP-dependent RNA helicase [Deltaproteobacteria bacterium CG11_big_fil_rev_8_21_14_0_20_45_16]|nr:MAG: ATP-dependent RNA helicase [Deltaproteobacteria bacterium CG11_big_fil_rev_8_21_14_0_20_45_16]